jgi:hypothetical protein
MNAPARTLCCPICGRELGITPHARGTRLSRSHVWLLHKLRDIGMSAKAIGMVLELQGRTVQGRIARARGQQLTQADYNAAIADIERHYPGINDDGSYGTRRP